MSTQQPALAGQRIAGIRTLTVAEQGRIFPDRKASKPGPTCVELDNGVLLVGVVSMLSLPVEQGDAAIVMAADADGDLHTLQPSTVQVSG